MGGEKHSHVINSLLPHIFKRGDMASWLKTDTGQLITTTNRAAVNLLARDLTGETRVRSLSEVGMEWYAFHEVAKRIEWVHPRRMFETSWHTGALCDLGSRFCLLCTSICFSSHSKPWILSGKDNYKIGIAPRFVIHHEHHGLGSYDRAWWGWGCVVAWFPERWGHHSLEHMCLGPRDEILEDGKELGDSWKTKCSVRKKSECKAYGRQDALIEEHWPLLRNSNQALRLETWEVGEQ